MCLSIAIPTLNESKSLLSTLTCVIRSFPPAYEVIIALYFSHTDTLTPSDQVIFHPKSNFWLVEGSDMRLSIIEETCLCLKMNKSGYIKQLKRKLSYPDGQLARQDFTKAFCVWAAICALWTPGLSNKYLKTYVQ